MSDLTTFPRSTRVTQMQSSSTLAVVQAAARLKARGVDVIDLGAGEPDFPTPGHIKEAAHQAIRENFTKYTPAAGTQELRQAIITRITGDYGIEYGQREVMATVGGKQAIFNAVVSLINPGDEVLIPAPYWVTFPEIVSFTGGRSVFIDTEPTGFQLTIRSLEEHLTPRSKLLILNYPSNPTGRALELDAFQKIVEKAVQHGLYVISDECYREFVYPPFEPFTAGQLPSPYRQRILICGTLSKTYAMTGWRLGYALGPQPWISEMIKLQSHSTSNPTSIAQKAAIAALLGPQEPIQAMLNEYRRRRDYFIPALDKLPGFNCHLPEGAFYAFPNIKEILKAGSFKSSKEVQMRLLEDYHIALTSGSAFGAEGYLRLSYANSLEVLKRSIEQLQRFVDHLSP